jgi:UDP-glucose 4-epimerase
MNSISFIEIAVMGHLIMRVLVTGSESFVGKELISQCLKNNISVVGCDSVSSTDKNYDFYKLDLRSNKIPSDIFENVDTVIHLAALSRDSDCKGRSHDCFNTNVMGTLNLIDKIKTTKVKQLIFASSEWVYDKFVGHEEKDEDAFIDISNHTSEYALSKLVSECNLRQEHNNNFCNVTILRFGIIYGPRKNNWSAVESIFNQVKIQDTVTVGSLKTGRRFVHVSDISKGIIQSFGLKGFNIINLTANQVITLKDIINMSEKILNRKINIQESNPQQISIRNPSNSKAKKLINWKSEISLEEGLRTIDIFLNLN